MAMAFDIPLPFRLEIPDDDSLELSGIRSVSYEVEGLLHLDEDALTFEWVARRQIERIGFTGIKKEEDESPVGRARVPLQAITRIRLRGWWWAPRLDLYARRLDAFEEVPTARRGVLTLKIRRPDRGIAAAMAAEIAHTPALDEESP
jgi:hypothetical protein